MIVFFLAFFYFVSIYTGSCEKYLNSLELLKCILGSFAFLMDIPLKLSDKLCAYNLYVSSKSARRYSLAGINLLLYSLRFLGNLNEKMFGKSAILFQNTDTSLLRTVRLVPDMPKIKVIVMNLP